MVCLVRLPEQAPLQRLLDVDARFLIAQLDLPGQRRPLGGHRKPELNARDVRVVEGYDFVPWRPEGRAGRDVYAVAVNPAQRTQRMSARSPPLTEWQNLMS